MKILIITTNFPRWAGDPHSPWLVELLGLLRQRGYQIEILAPAYAGQDSHVIDDMPVHRFRYAPARWETLTHEEGAPAKIRRQPLYLLLLPVYLLAGAWAAWRLARWHSFNVIHVHWPVPQGILGVVARWAVERHKSKAAGSRDTDAQITPPPRHPVPRLVATFYGADLVLAQRFKFLTPFLRWFTRRCDDVAAISSYTCRELIDLTGSSPRTIPYGIALPPPDVAWPTEPGKIVYVGRLIPRKGVQYLVEAMAQLRDLPAAYLVIVGDGPERADLEAIVAAQGLSDRVSFAGRVSAAELEEHYRTCSVFVLPSIVDPTGDTEMLGMVLLEAMRYRKPVIASNVGGIPDIVQHEGNGLLVPQQNPQALAAAVRRLLADRALAEQLGEAGYVYARNHFSWEAVVRETEGLYGRHDGMSRQFLTADGADIQRALPERNKRIAVVGTTGSGKSVLARTLSQRLGIPHVELDAFYWQPDWTPASEEAFCMAVAAAIDGPHWIVDGNHSAVRDRVWGRANTLIWLDYPLPVLFWRLFRRSVRRILWKEELWNGNRESLRNQVVWRVGRRTLLRMLGRETAEGGGESFQYHGTEAQDRLLNGHRARHQFYRMLLARPEYAHLRVIRLASPRATQTWLASVEETSSQTD